MFLVRISLASGFFSYLRHERQLGEHVVPVPVQHDEEVKSLRGELQLEVLVVVVEEEGLDYLTKEN